MLFESLKRINMEVANIPAKSNTTLGALLIRGKRQEAGVLPLIKPIRSSAQITAQNSIQVSKPSTILYGQQIAMAMGCLNGGAPIQGGIIALDGSSATH